MSSSCLLKAINDNTRYTKELIVLDLPENSKMSQYFFRQSKTFDGKITERKDGPRFNKMLTNNNNLYSLIKR